MNASTQHPDSDSAVDVSILIVNYNVRDFLQHCLDSIARSRQPLTVQVIVVDNDSHDRSVELLAPKYPWVQFVSMKENIGFGRANNEGLRLCTGRYVLLLNPDTIIQEDTLEQMTAYMDAHSEIGISGCKVLNADGTFQMQCRRGFPSPWASFCKLFGLQALFPRSPLFARYNQTFRSEDETYQVDAVIGAFMFCRRNALVAIGGFDEDFFMYGEDLDLCYRMAQHGLATAYVPITTIVHFKGESTRRSSINELRVFYDAMQIFARKHYGSSRLFLWFLSTGINVRSMLAYVLRYKRSLGMMLCDMICVLLTFVLAVKLRRGDYLALPAYAFPTVFIVIPSVVLASMLIVGEYFEYKPTIRRATIALLMSFFFLSSLTYYFNEYAFSRGVLLMTIGFSIISTAIVRALFALVEKTYGKESHRRIVLVGSETLVHAAAERLHKENALRVDIVGYVGDNTQDLRHGDGVPLLGHRDYLLKVIHQHAVDEVIILGSERSTASMISTMKAASGLGVRFHYARDSDSVVALGIAEGISTRASAASLYPILSFRAKIFKRFCDLVCSTLILLILLPMVILGHRSARQLARRWWNVFVGSSSVVGLYPPAAEPGDVAKIGMTGLAHISHPQQLSAQTIRDLNEYYVRNYSPSLDIDICIKSIFSTR